MLEGWQKYVDRYLVRLCDVVRDQYAWEDSQGIIATFGGRLSVSLPWGMDDGNGLVLLTVIGAAHDEPYDRRRVRVIVSADSGRFGDSLTVHEYGKPQTDIEWGDFSRKAAEERQELEEPPNNITGRMAEYLRRHHDGGPLCREANGALSFTMQL